MNLIYSNGRKIVQTDEHIEVDNVKYPLPDYVKKSNSNSLIINKNSIEINGFLFNPDTGEFKRKGFFK